MHSLLLVKNVNGCYTYLANLSLQFFSLQANLVHFNLFRVISNVSGLIDIFINENTLYISEALLLASVLYFIWLFYLLLQLIHVANVQLSKVLDDFPNIFNCKPNLEQITYVFVICIQKPVHLLWRHLSSTENYIAVSSPLPVNFFKLKPDKIRRSHHF